MGLCEAVGVEPTERGTDEHIVRLEPQIQLERADCLARRNWNLRTQESLADAAPLEPVAQQASLERCGGGSKTVQIDEPSRVSLVWAMGSGQTARLRRGGLRMFWPVRRFRLDSRALTASR
jgi:hypothetical protein